MTPVVLLFTTQEKRLIDPKISKTYVHKFTSNNWGECHTTFALEMRYRLIPPRVSNIVNPSIPSKPR